MRWVSLELTKTVIVQLMGTNENTLVPSFISSYIWKKPKLVITYHSNDQTFLLSQLWQDIEKLYRHVTCVNISCN